MNTTGSEVQKRLRCSSMFSSRTAAFFDVQQND
jgi:hypothetical protein